MDIEITSTQNPKVKQWAQLLEKSGREKYNQFLIEGVHLIEEAIQADALIHTIVYRLDGSKPHDLYQATRDKSMSWVGVSPTIFAKCTDTHSPQHVFAIVEKPDFTIEPFLERDQHLVIVVDGIQDPGNLGTIIRSADAVGASGIVLGQGTVDVFNPKTIRSTMGSIFHVPIIEVNLSELLLRVKDKGIQFVSTSLQATQTCYEVDYRKPTWFIVGNEARGVSRSVALHADIEVIIPMPGQAESLNVAMATTVLLFEANRQRITSRKA
jgi:TrmH family RNA methyltransferase